MADDPQDPPDPQDPDPQDPPDPVKGPADQLDWQAAARKHEREVKKLRTENDNLRKANQTEAEAALEKARNEGAQSARTELGSELTKTRLELAVIKSVGAKFADPADAALFLDVDSVTDDKGTVDQTALGRAVDKLLEAKPYLAAAGGGTTRVPQGARGGATSNAGDGDMNARIRQAAGR